MNLWVLQGIEHERSLIVCLGLSDHHMNCLHFCSIMVNCQSFKHTRLTLLHQPLVFSAVCLTCLCNMACIHMLVQGRPDVGPHITEVVVSTVKKVNDVAGMADEVGALLKFVEHTFQMREVIKQRKLWEDDRQAKVTEAIANAMKEWDDVHYPRLLEATWGWHPFYTGFVANPFCFDFRPPYPLCHSIVEGSDAQELVLQQCNVERIYPVPWSALLLRCFLKFHTLLPPVVSHPTHGSTIANVTEWSKRVVAVDGEGSRAWQLATKYLKVEGFLLFADSRPVQTREQWVTEVDDAFKELRNPSTEWFTELHMWCDSVRFRAVQDMAFHDSQAWLKAWVIRDRPPSSSPPLASYERWLQHREDVDIGYVLANPGIFRRLCM